MLNLPNIYLKEECETGVGEKNGTCILLPLHVYQKCYSFLEM